MIEKVKLIIELIKTLIWPAVVVGIILMFRKQIGHRIKDIKEVELPGGFKAKLNEEKKVESIIEETTNELEKIETEQIDNDKKNELRKQVLIEKFKNIEEQIDNTSSNNTTRASITKSIEEKNKGRTMLAFACGDSVDENLKYNIYYDPVARNHNTPFKYIGLYTGKAVVAVGELKKIICCDYENGQLIATNGDNLSKISKDEYNRIKEMIENPNSYEVKTGHKFFIVDNFYKTNYIKESDYALRAKKYFWLDEIEGFRDGMSASEVTKLLDGKEWI